MVRMRAAALRGPARTRALLGLLLIPALAVVAGLAGGLLPAAGRDDARLLMPTAWLGFAVTAAVAAGTSGSRTLLTRAQSVVFPVTAAAEHLGALLLAPLNVAWLTQTLALLALATWGFGGTPATTQAVLLALAWIVASTVVAQAVSTAVELARTSRSGLWLVRALVAAALAAAAVPVLAGRVTDVLDQLPTVPLIVAISAVWGGDSGPWLRMLALLAAATALAHLIGWWLTARLQRRSPRDQVRVESRRYRPRRDPAGELAAALRIDRAGVWRSAPLRRGLATLVAVPALAALAAGLDWPLVALLPGLVASGAGLLFGVNALCLDGPGAIWRESLPGAPRTVLLARLLVVTEVCFVAALIAAALGAARAPGRPSTGALLAVAGAVLATTAQVVGRCATWSVEQPYAASMRDARDQPAPPAAMAGYSARLAIGTTVTGLAFWLCARHDLAGTAVAIAVAVTALGLRRVLSALRRWDDHAWRNRVLGTVAAG